MKFLFIITGLSFCLQLLYCEFSKAPVSNPVSKYPTLTWYRVHVDEDSIWSYSIYFTDLKNGWIVGKNGQIKYTSDGGFNWSNQNSGVNSLLYHVFFLNSELGWVCGTNSCIIKTEDGGNSWNSSYEDVDSTKVFTFIQFTDYNNGWAVNNNGEILHSDNGGQTWIIQYSWDIGGTALMSIIDRNTVYAIPFIGDYMLKTNNGGSSWNTVTMNDQPRWQTDMFFLTENLGWLTSTVAPSSMMEYESPVFHTNNGGSMWTRQDSLYDKFLTSVWFVDENIGWITGHYSIFYTENGGSNWTIQYSPDSIRVAFHDLFFIDEENGWALDWYGSVYKYFKE